MEHPIITVRLWKVIIIMKIAVITILPEVLAELAVVITMHAAIITAVMHLTCLKAKIVTALGNRKRKKGGFPPKEDVECPPEEVAPEEVWPELPRKFGRTH